PGLRRHPVDEGGRRAAREPQRRPWRHEERPRRPRARRRDRRQERAEPQGSARPVRRPAQRLRRRRRGRHRLHQGCVRRLREREDGEGRREGGGGVNADKDPRDIIIAPVVSEKSYGLIDEGKYTFVVDTRANKTEIKLAIEKIFGV